VTITLLGYLSKADTQIKGSPFYVDVSPGEIMPINCFTSLGTDIVTIIAGETKFFQIDTYDLWNNKQVTSYDDTAISMIAYY
jgi:hypothetical protein